MAGRTPTDAYQNYIEPMREALQCITRERLTVRERQRLRIDTLYSVALRDMDPVPLIGKSRLRLTVGQNIRIIKLDSAEDPRGPYKIQTTRYLYVFAMDDDREIIGFHWERDTEDGEEPHSVDFPHLHVGPAMIGENPAIRPKNLHKAHIPTGRISLEAVIRLAIMEFEVRPLRRDWDAVLRRTEAAFMEWKTR